LVCLTSCRLKSFGLQLGLLSNFHIALEELECVRLRRTSILKKHRVNQFDSGLNQRYKSYISTSCLVWERLGEPLGEGDTNVRSGEHWDLDFSQSVTEECCVQILHIKARVLVATVLEMCTSKTKKLCFLESRTGGSFDLNSQYVDSYLVLSVVSHVDTPVILWAKTTHQSAELSYLWLAAHLVFLKLECFSLFRRKKLAILFPQTEKALS